MPKKKTILDLQQMKVNGEQAVWMVIYDSCLASRLWRKTTEMRPERENK